MEFTDQGVNPQDSARIPPISGYSTVRTHRADSLRYDFGEGHHLHSSLSSPSLHSDFKREIIREMEKERIREEIREEMIISEMARRRAVEAEVRRELMLQMDYSAPRMVSFLSSSPQMMGFDVSPTRHSINLVARAEETAFEAKTGGVPEKKKLIILGDKQSDKNISGTKRKVESPPAPVAESIDIPTTTKAKEAAAGNLRYSFWCDICKVGTHSEDVMLCHKRGRKHMNRLGRNEAKVSVVVNNLSQWVDAYRKKCSTQVVDN